MQLARQSLPFFERGQLAPLIVEARVFDGDRGLIGQRPRQLGFARLELPGTLAVDDRTPINRSRALSGTISSERACPNSNVIAGGADARNALAAAL